MFAKEQGGEIICVATKTEVQLCTETLEQVKEVKKKDHFSWLGIKGRPALGEADLCLRRRNTSAAVFYSSLRDKRNQKKQNIWFDW